jgi:L-iditol 2-dehydrogenase
MKAAVLYGKEDVRVEEVASRPLQPGEVRIQIEAALTCGTDLKVFKRGYHAKMIVPPAVFGHELAGTVCEVRSAECGVRNEEAGMRSAECSEVRSAECGVRNEDGARTASALEQSNSLVASEGSKTDTFIPAHGTPIPIPHSALRTPHLGDRVVVANSAPCGRCFYCGAGQENLCEDLLFLNGAYAESIVVPERLVRKNLLKLKPETPFRDAALTEPLACVVQGVEDLHLQAGQNVLVLGSGPIGLMFLALANHLGCKVTMAGRRASRLEAAQRLGAAQVIDIGDGTDLVKRIRSAANTRFDVVVEAVGKPETWEASVQLVRKGGAVNFFGGCPNGTSITLDTTLIHYSNLTLLASFHHTPKTIRRALEFIEKGVVRAADFVDGEYKLSELPALLKSMTTGNRAVKSLIRVRE